MRILVEPNAHHLQNVGDVAMLQVAVTRLRVLWPSAKIAVITDAPELLAEYCPSTVPVSAEGRRIWFGDRLIGNRVHEVLPARIAPRAKLAEDRLRVRQPLAASAIIKAKRRLRGKGSAELDSFVSAVLSSDLVVVSGAGAITDEFAPLAMTILDLLDLANRRGIPTAMFGQGVGPIDDAALRRKANDVLPRVGTIALRERLCGLPILRSFGVDSDRIFVTGDDAIELAYRPDGVPRTARAIGVSLRRARYSRIDRHALEAVQATLRAAAAEYDAGLVGLPISRYHKEADADVIAELMPDGATSVEPPVDAQDVIERIGRCRLVVTGSYHAGVFALAQGIPVIGLAASKYYVSKFEGLIDQFGRGCTIVRFDDESVPARLADAIDHAWHSAADVREGLRAAAKSQIDRGHVAYATLRGTALDFNCADQASSSWEERAVRAVALLRRHFVDPRDSTKALVIGDFGAGNERLRRILARDFDVAHDYRSYDLNPQRPETVRIDFATELPEQRFDIVFCLGLLEYLRDPADFLCRLGRNCDTAVLSYVLFDGPERLTSGERRDRGWLTDLTRAELEEILAQAGFNQIEFEATNRDRTGIWLVTSRK